MAGIRAGGLEGIDWQQWHGEQFACAFDVGRPGRAGEQAVIADAMKAWGQHVHEEAANELMVVSVIT